VRLTDSNCRALGLGPISEFNIENVTAKDHGYAVTRVAMPRSCVSRRKLQAPDQVITAMMKYLFVTGRYHTLCASLSVPPALGNYVFYSSLFSRPEIRKEKDKSEN
jgi:hypothetical protein